jgi:hypothetical protein
MADPRVFFYCTFLVGLKDESIIIIVFKNNLHILYFVR